MRSRAAEATEPALVIEGVRVPCRDAQRRVWQALELARREYRQALGKNQEPAVGRRGSALESVGRASWMAR